MSEKKLQTLKITDLEFSNYREFGDINDLRVSLAKIGQQEPIIVEPSGPHKFVVKDGHRRVAALKSLKKTEVLAFVTDQSSDKKRRLVEQIAINNVRKLDSYDLAAAVKKLVDEGYSQLEIAEALGRDESHTAKLYNLLIDNVAYLAFVSGRDLLVHKNDTSGALFFLTKEEIENAGHNVFDFIALKGLGENAPSIFNCKPLVEMFKDLDMGNPVHLQNFNMTLAYMIRKQIRDKASIESVALRIRSRLLAKKGEAKPIDTLSAARKITSIFEGGKVDNLKALQKAIRSRLRESNVPYDIIIRHLDEPSSTARSE